jgi:hypothetical protein
VNREESDPKDDPLEIVQHRINVFRLDMLQYIDTADHLMRNRGIIETRYAWIIESDGYRMIDLKVLAEATLTGSIVQDLTDAKVIDQLANLRGELHRGHPIVGVAGVQALLLGFVGFGDHIFALSFSSTYGA